SNYLYGLDVLERHAVRATFFVTAGWMGVRDGFMSWPELRELVSRGHAVQAHGWSHRPLPACSDAELEEELGRAKQTIEDRLAIPVEALSIPHGRWDERVLKACSAAGYRRGFFSEPPAPAPHTRGSEAPGRRPMRRCFRAARLSASLT